MYRIFFKCWYIGILELLKVVKFVPLKIMIRKQGSERQNYQKRRDCLGINLKLRGVGLLTDGEFYTYDEVMGLEEVVSNQNQRNRNIIKVKGEGSDINMEISQEGSGIKLVKRGKEI